jgi:hypothetical protein
MSDAQSLAGQKTIPPEIDRWNWGAFLLNWIWGIGNNTFIALLALIPFVGFVMLFVLGAKGSRWAWQNRRWQSVEQFKRVQRLWAIWGVVIWIAIPGLALAGGLVGGLVYQFTHSQAYRLGVAKLQASPVAADLLGTPISAGFPFGKMSVDATSSGKANLHFSASGPRASGVVFVEAVKKDGVWSITRLALKVDGRDNAIDLIGGTTKNST